MTDLFGNSMNTNANSALAIQNGSFNFGNYNPPTSQDFASTAFTDTGTTGGFFGDSFKDLNSTLGTAGKLLGGFSSLAQIGLGFKALGMADDELDIKKDQWKESKAELNHLRATRKRISDSYMSGSAVKR